MSTYTVSLNNYTYTLDDSTYTCSAVWAGSSTATTVTGLMDSILYEGDFYKLTSLNRCFYGLTTLTDPPRIPNTVTNMSRCFYGCTALKYPPKIPGTVTTMYYCFFNCSALFVPECFIIPTSVTELSYCFSGCTSMTKCPTILGADISMDYTFRGTSITDFRGLPKLYDDYMECTACTNSSITYGSEELNYQAIKHSVYNTTSASSPYYNSTISTWPKFTTTTGTVSIKTMLQKLVERCNELTSQCSTIVSSLGSAAAYDDSDASLLTNLYYDDDYFYKICNYMSTDGITYRHYHLSDATSACMCYYYYAADGFVVCRSIHSPDAKSTTSRAGRTSSYTFYNTVSQTYSSTYSALLKSGLAIWQSRGLFKHMRTGSTGTGLITINGTMAVSGQTLTYTYEAWGNSNTTWSDTLVSELCLQQTNSIDYTYNNVTW